MNRNTHGLVQYTQAKRRHSSNIEENPIPLDAGCACVERDRANVCIGDAGQKRDWIRTKWNNNRQHSIMQRICGGVPSDKAEILRKIFRIHGAVLVTDHLIKFVC